MLKLKKMLKKLQKELIPPFFLKLGKRAKSVNLEPTYESYKKAIKAGGSYEEFDLIKVIVAKTKQYIEQYVPDQPINFSNLSNAGTIRTLLAISAGANKKNITVLDFGGSAGIHYFTARQIISKDITLKWCVVETEALVNEAISEGLENDELLFFSTIEEASNKVSNFDLVYSNDALCYSPTPLFYLDQLLQTNFKKFFLTNTLLNSKNEDDIIGLQTSTLATNGVGRNIPSHLGIADREIIYPFTILSKARVESKIKDYGSIVYNIKEKEATKSTVDGIFDSYGYLITSKNRN